MGARGAVLAAIGKVAPDVDLAELRTDVDLRAAAGIDSLDFIAILTAVHDATGVEVPELDFPLVTSVDALTTYVEAHMA